MLNVGPGVFNELTFRKLSLSGEVIQPTTLPGSPPPPDTETCPIPDCGHTFVINEKRKTANVYVHIRDTHTELTKTQREELVESEKASKREQNRRRRDTVADINFKFRHW